ncbi:MAG: hypothetical protein ACE5JO_08050 [Candidatus Binatia bacterium]
MLRLIALIALVVILFLAVSGGFVEKLKPHVERVAKFASRVATNMKSDLETRIPGRAVTPEEHVSPEAHPYPELIDEGVITEEFRAKPWAAPEEKRREEPSVATNPYDAATVRGDQAKTERFADSYDEAKRKLLEAMSILEGEGSGT